MFKRVIFCILFAVVNIAAVGETVTLQSPDGTIEICLDDKAGLSYSVNMDGDPVILKSKLKLEMANDESLGVDAEIVSQTTSRFNQTWEAVMGNKSQIVNHYCQATIQLQAKHGSQRRYAIECRAYNDGVAFRYVFGSNFGDTVNIKEEHSEFTFNDDFTCWPAYLNSYTTEHQALYPKEALSSITTEDIIGLPLTIQMGQNRFCSIMEAALVDWAGVYVTRPGDSDLLIESDAFVGGGKPFVFSQKIPAGTKTIRMIVDAADGNSHDHVDIADAKFIMKNGDILWLSDLQPVTVRQEWGRLRKDQSVNGNSLRIAGKGYDKGLGTHSTAVIAYEVPRGSVKIAGVVGIDSEVQENGKAKFKLYAVKNSTDDKIVLKSALSRLNEGQIPVQVKTPHVSPWRVVMLGRRPADLVNSDIVLNLNEPCKIKDASWIKPGVSSWNWLSCGGEMDMALLKGFIDLSAEMGWEYALIDDGWYANWDCTQSIDKLDIPELVAYAAQKNVRLWLWVHWQALDRRLEESFTLYEKWGIAGVKTDFMSRDDQWMVNWYHKVLKSAADHRLMIDFHGCYKPTGVCRTWPNLMTREAIYGEEQNLGSRQNDPVHKTTLPFTRMLAGAMDYTPGSMLNETAESWSAGRPVKTIGTRCQELAICVIYDSPFLSMADKPENYYGQKGIEFLKDLPTSWDDTKVLNGAIGEYITTARQKGDTWYLASITSKERTMDLSLDFLGAGSYKLVLYEDGPNAATTDATDIRRREILVTSDDTITVRMAAGGGLAVILQKIQ